MYQKQTYLQKVLDERREKKKYTNIFFIIICCVKNYQNFSNFFNSVGFLGGMGKSDQMFRPHDIKRVYPHSTSDHKRRADRLRNYMARLVSNQNFLSYDS